MKRLDEIYFVVQRRIDRLNQRQSDDWIDDLRRKVSNAMGIIDEITQQYAQGTNRETKIERLMKEIAEFDATKKKLKEMKFGAKLKRDLTALKKQFFG